MRISTNYKLREIAGETIVVNQGASETDLTRIISLNASARLLWENLSGKEFELDDAANILTNVYGIGEGQAGQDASAWIAALKKCNIIIE